ncbi:hypothetical protein BV378_11750 [Nostoc sp. RF31YmG]|nr:hypothetical protein BV378_11750 [Nostoc sp. RF31YmG]
MDFLNSYVMLKPAFIVISKSKERLPPTMETGLIGVKDGVFTLELAQKSQPLSSDKKENVQNVDFTSTWRMQSKSITLMEITATPKWKI